MRLLLDTHALLWFLLGDDHLPVMTRILIADADQAFASSASAWEIATKVRIGRLPEAAPLIDRYAATVEALAITTLDVTTLHALHAGSYNLAHGDPFDRLLAAQAELEGLILITKDKAFADFPCATRW